MARITSSVGLVSGIDSGAIIDELVSLDSEPMTVVQAEITKAQFQEQAYTALGTSLGQIQTVGQSLALPQTFEAATTTSSDPNVLTATAAEGAAVGSYQFQVAQLVSTQQSISNGFANSSTTPVGAGTITLEEGGGEASSQTTLDQLNGGAGVSRGQFRITDRSGASTVIDTSTDVNLDDVIHQINTATNVNVKATLTNKGIVLTDETGKTTNDLSVTDLAGGSAASSLGIAGDAGASSNTLTGTSINDLGTGTQLSSLNDGLGVRAATGGNPDFKITVSDGTTFNITLGNDSTIGDVLSSINNAGGSKVKASLTSDGSGIKIQDTSGGGGSFSVAALGGSKAASDLGIATTGAGGVINGKQLVAGLDSVLVSSLNGGNGIALGQISIADRAGHSTVVDLSNAKSVSDILTDINNSGVGVSAALNRAGTGIQLTDTSGGTGNLIIGDVNSTTAAALGIAGTYDTSKQTITGNNLQRQYINENTQLTDLGAGAGVNLGKFKITDSTGATSVVDLSSGTFNTVGDVISAINSEDAGVTASINANGNGLLLTDTAGGAGKLTVAEDGGTTASDLNILGTATGTTIDGAFQKTISVSATDTLATVQSKINSLGFGVTANIVSDGSATNPYRLSITSNNSGETGRVLIDGGTTNLDPRTLVQGKDAAVLIGGDGSSQPLLVTSSKNQLTNVIKGVTVNLLGTSTSPVTLNVTNDPSGVQTDLQNFTTSFNSIVTSLATFTKFDTSTNQGGLLLGDSTAQQLQSTLYTMVNSVVSGAGKFKTLADVGITIGDGASLTFDPTKFQAAYAADPDSVKNLFSQATTGFGDVIDNAVKTLTDPVNGLITLQENTLQTRVQNYQDYFNQLNSVVQLKKAQLEEEYANLETTLAGLQGQQAALGTLSGSSSSSGSSSAGSSASSGSSSSGSSSGSSSSGTTSSGTSSDTSGSTSSAATGTSGSSTTSSGTTDTSTSTTG